MRPARESWINPALSLALCAAAAQARLPLPWMIGPLVAMAACNFAGAELRAMRGARESAARTARRRSSRACRAARPR